MKLSPLQLKTHLAQQLAPIYFVSGDETLLLQEAHSAILNAAKKSGFEEKQTFYYEAGFNWTEFVGACDNLSLFSDKLILELHLQAKVTEAGAKVLQNYATNLPDDKILIITSAKLEPATAKTSWYKAIDQIGVTIPVWPIEQQQMPAWISQRLHVAQIKTDTAGIQLLVEHAAGNLLAAQQEIEKLSLIYGAKFIAANEILSVLTDNSKYNIYHLADAWLQQEKKLACKIISNLKSEGVEPTLILWALTRELRNVINIAETVKAGSTVDAALEKHKVWMNRKVITKKIVQLHQLDALYKKLHECAMLDLIIKGAAAGDFWLELERFCCCLL
jgi:DNA polymerase III subunit delta